MINIEDVLTHYGESCLLDETIDAFKAAQNNLNIIESSEFATDDDISQALSKLELAFKVLSDEYKVYVNF